MNCKEQTDKYSHYKYTTWCDGEHMGTWIYVIHIPGDYGVNHDIECDEYYDTREDAIKAAEDHIDKLEDGPDEPDYDAPTAEEMYQRAHDDRQKLRGY